MKKIIFVLLWGPLFVGAPVRPNMLNMPKSASALNMKIFGGWIPFPRMQFVSARYVLVQCIFAKFFSRAAQYCA